MVKKIIHASDIHIRNIKRHEEYREQLSKFIDECKNLSEEYEPGEVRIVITGDLFHQKIQTSNEQTQLLAWFLQELNQIAKTLIMAGNHDYMEGNSDRLDSLTPIVDLLKLSNIIYIDKELNYKSGIYIDDNIAWCLYSIYDNYNKPDIDINKIDYPNNKFVGLFHGALTGTKTDVGFEFEHGISMDIFEGLDFCLCGDIHKRQGFDVKNTKIAYSGSLIQQDKGESVSGHGYLVWDVEESDYEEFDIESDYGYYKFRINSIKELEDGIEEFVNF